MSHLIEEYAKNLGVKISEPIVNDHFFPITQCKYITLNQAGVASKTYSHYDIVLSLLKPFLDRADIKVIQIGGDKKIEGTEAALNISFKQQAFVLSKSLLHFGCDGALAQVASNKKIPTVTIYGNAFPANVKPFFSKSTINKSIQPNWDKKPCFATEDPKRQIDTIKPEIIAQKVLDLLDIEKESIKFVTKNIGELFSQSVVEIIPTSFSPLRIPQGQEVMIRTDYGCDEVSFLKYCSNYKVSITADSLIQPHGLQKIANNINKFFLFIDSSWDTIPANYFAVLKNLNIDLTMLVKNEDDLNALRNKYFDTPVVLYEEAEEAPCKLGDDSRFMSSLRLIEGGKEYLSYAHWKKSLDGDNKVLDTPEYWRESKHFYIYDRD
tara:strand:- start:340 stop:1479 length:1140 start_codon:yes stop_codon:yes gene_type:complete